MDVYMNPVVVIFNDVPDADAASLMRSIFGSFNDPTGVSITVSSSPNGPNMVGLVINVSLNGPESTVMPQIQNLLSLG